MATVQEVMMEQQQQDNNIGNHLLGTCVEVEYEIGWFGTSTKLDRDDVNDMLSTVGASKDSVSISKRLLSSKHPAVKVANEAKRAITNYVNAMTIPKIAMSRGLDNAVEFKKAAGKRLLRLADLEEFDRHLDFLWVQLQAAVTALASSMPDIIEFERRKLGRLFRETDYPTNISSEVTFSKSYGSSVPVQLAEVAPEIYRRQEAMVREMYKEAAASAAKSFGEEFLAVTKKFVEQLGYRRRVRVANSAEGAEELGKWTVAELQDAEVVNTITTLQDPDLPAGQIVVELRFKPIADTKNTIEVFGPMSMERFEAIFTVYETDEKKKCFESTVDALKTHLEMFHRVGDMWGDSKEAFEQSVQRVRDILMRANTRMDSRAILDELRGGDFLRSSLRSSLSEVASALESSVVLVKDQQAGSRRIKASL